VSGLVVSVEGMTTVDEFFAGYRDALMARDERRVARLYAVPGLILFPGQRIAVSDERQTEHFFASAWGQYKGVTDTHTEIAVVAETSGSVWADVTWHHEGAPAERLMYQLVETEDGWKIAVLTPLA
jgi:ketosteroid isomerase-like protein